MARVLEVIGEDVLRSESKTIGEHLVLNEAKNIGKFELSTLKNVEHMTLNPAINERIAKKEINDTITKLALSDAKFSSTITKIWHDFKGSAKIAAGVTAIAFTTNYVYKYMYHNSGPFYTIKDKKYRIKDPYPCGFKLKKGDITHPLDNEIRKKFKNPCDNYEYYDSCGGWASLSRLQVDIDPARLLKIEGKFTCEHASVADALKSLAKEAYTNVVHLFGGKHFLSTLLSIISGIVSYTVSRLSNISYINSIIIAVITIFLIFFISLHTFN